MNNHVTIYWRDGSLAITPEVPDELCKVLKYWQRTLAKREGYGPQVATGSYIELYTLHTNIDPETQVLTHSMLTMPGLLYKVTETLKACGWTFDLVDNRTPAPKPDYIAAAQGLRDYQIDGVWRALYSGGGIFSAPTGFGKTHVMAALVKAFKRDELRDRGTPLTVVACPEQDITRKNYNDLVKLLPDRDVGILMTGHNKRSEDVQVITFASLHKLDPEDVGVFIADEVHTAASDSRAEHILAMTKALKWGVSATPTGRFDGRDLVTEGLFGPVVYQSTYADGVRAGALVPITVYWIKCPEPSIGVPKFLNYSSRNGRYRHGIWRNKNRNALIGQILQDIPDAMQTLCIMPGIEQMNEIVPYCGEHIHTVHAEQSPSKCVQYKHISSITQKERRGIYSKMEAAEIKKILSTHVYKQGVNFPHLEVVVNAGGGGSDIVARQIPGRESRKTETKERAFLIDFWHPWDVKEGKNKKAVPGPLRADDLSREKSYSHLEFEQVWLDDVNALPLLHRPKKP